MMEEIYITEIEKEGILDLPKGKVKININSMGGSVLCAMGYYDMLIAKKEKIITVGVGTVQSAAIYPYICGDERRSHKNTLYMLHGIEIEGQDDLKAVSDLAKKMNNFSSIIATRMAKISKKDYKYWYKILNGKTKFFTAEEFKKLGIVTKII